MLFVVVVVVVLALRLTFSMYDSFFGVVLRRYLLRIHDSSDF